ncbi:MAG TPA: SRPBCC family protein [Polyangiaceae bacterium]|nr:SRPBCC family protein [Polyangiaceae bacterium]
MDARSENQPIASKNRTTVERSSEREILVTRTVNGPARLVWEAWTKAELFKQWWVPKSFGLTLLSCEVDARVGGKYRLVFRHGGGEMAFFGKYLEVIPNSRLVWTNEETEGGAISTLTLEEKAGKTLVLLRDLFPSKEACDAAMTSGEKDGSGETFEQLDALLVALAG